VRMSIRTRAYATAATVLAAAVKSGAKKYA
jgi:hypothetical protein